MVDATRQAPSVSHGDRHLGTELLRAVVGHVRMRAGRDQRQQAADPLLHYRVAFEVAQPHRPVSERAGGHVLDRELAGERRPWIGVVGVRQAAPMRQDFDALHAIGRNAFLAHQRQHHGNRRMRRAAAGKLLETVLGRLDLPGRTPVLEHPLGPVVAPAIEDLEPALLVLERAGVRLEAALGDQRREQAIAPDVADVQRLRHGAEVRLDAARERGRERQGLGGARNVEPEKMGGRCRRSERPECRCRVPALVVVMEIDRARQAHLGLDADDVSRQRPPARNLQLLAERKDGRRHGCRVVPAHHA